jgi:prepilin signal peptidase PulO-like enzyme (type II secretory pathway)
MELIVSLLLFVFGLCVGSFLNVVILRLANNERFSASRSYCPSCRHQLAWFDLVPLASFILLRGRCRYCQAHISWQYPLVEAASGVLWLSGYLWLAPELSTAISFGAVLPLLTFGVFGSLLLALFVFDARWYILPDEVTLPALAVALTLNIWRGYDWHTLVTLGLVGAGWFYIQYAVSKGKWVGDGDMRLGALVAVMVGSFPALFILFLLTYLSGALVGLGLLAAGKKTWGGQLPLGTFMTAATIVVLVWGEPLWQWYSGFLW